MTDLFGRSPEQVRAYIASQEKLLPIIESYRGNEGTALAIARFKASLEVDRRQLFLVERGIDPKLPGNDRAIRAALKAKWPDFEYRDSLAGDRLYEWRERLLSTRSYAQQRKSA